MSGQWQRASPTTLEGGPAMAPTKEVNGKEPRPPPWRGSRPWHRQKRSMAKSLAHQLGGGGRGGGGGGGVCH
eukprot:6557967-Pyramimonas_sp.AAC.1